MNFLKQYKYVFFFIFCLLVSSVIFGSKLGLAGFIVIDEGLLKARIYNTLAHLGLFSTFLAIFILIREKEEIEDKSWIFYALVCIVLVSIQFGYHVTCDSIYKYCRSYPSDSEYAVCHDKNKDYAC